MTYSELMKNGWSRTVPQFLKHLPDFTGYIAVTGETIFYGEDYRRRKGLAPYGTADPLLPKETEVVPFIAPPKPRPCKRVFHCKACGEPTDTDRHHLVPRQIFRGTREAMKLGNHTIRLCRPCHEVIHKLGNALIATMDVTAQVAYIRGVLVEREYTA